MKKLFINQSNDKINLHDLYDRFIKVRECSNVSPYTITYYERVLRDFGRFFDIERPCSDINIETIQDYVVFLKNRGYKLCYRRNYITKNEKQKTANNTSFTRIGKGLISIVLFDINGLFRYSFNLILTSL